MRWKGSHPLSLAYLGMGLWVAVRWRHSSRSSSKRPWPRLQSSGGSAPDAAHAQTLHGLSACALASMAELVEQWRPFSMTLSIIFLDLVLRFPSRCRDMYINPSLTTTFDRPSAVDVANVEFR